MLDGPCSRYVGNPSHNAQWPSCQIAAYQNGLLISMGSLPYLALGAATPRKEVATPDRYGGNTSYLAVTEVKMRVSEAISH
jgi:hypothetical protein